MALPLISFVAGVAVGSLVTYVATDKALQQRAATLTNDAAAGIRARTDKVVSMLPELRRDAAAKAGAVVHAVQGGAVAASTEAKAIVDKALEKARRNAAKSGSADEETRTS